MTTSRRSGHSRRSSAASRRHGSKRSSKPSAPKTGTPSRHDHPSRRYAYPPDGPMRNMRLEPDHLDRRGPNKWPREAGADNDPRPGANRLSDGGVAVNRAQTDVGTMLRTRVPARRSSADSLGFDVVETSRALARNYPGDSDTAFRASSAGVLQRTQILDVSLRFVQPASGSGDLPPAGGKGKAAVRSQQPWVVHCAV